MAAAQFPSETASQDPEMSRTLVEAEMEDRRQGEGPPQGSRWRLLRSAGLMGLLLAAGALFVMLSSGAQPLTWKPSSAEQATYGKATTIHEVSEITQLHVGPEGCHYSCETCSAAGSSTKCSTCADSSRRALVSSSGGSSTCRCRDGFFDDGCSPTCEACHYSCGTCSGAGSSDCLTCPSGSHRSFDQTDKTCLCAAGFSDDGRNPTCAAKCPSPSQGPCGTGDACVDITQNNKHCGECGRTCGAGQHCQGGICQCSTPGLHACAPLAGQPTKCVDFDCDDNNCGHCNTKCNADKGQRCVEGHCQCMDPTPNACFQNDNLQTCVNFLTDDDNCGGCNKKCGTGQKCRRGYCECLDTAGTGKISFCGTGDAAKCVDVLTDNDNCGTCGTRCTGSTTCVSGTCQCDMGYGRCSDSTCIDFQTSRQHCGRCSIQCRDDQLCIQGNCQCTGNNPNECTNPSTGSTTCVNLQTNNAHCGRCNRQCSEGLICQDGTCQCLSTLKPDFCNNLAGDKCTDLSSDPDNCGTCGNKCGAQQTCAAGSCQCPLRMRLCSGVCIDFENDRKNCGFCGNKCPKQQKCQDGYCQCINDGDNDADGTGLDACGVPAGAICVDRRSDSKNCGVCNKQCPAAQVCRDGYCQCVDDSTSDTSKQLINACGTPLGSLCVSFKSDKNHCGGCDNRCSEGQDCVEGVCKCTDATKKDACGTCLGGFTCVSLATDRDNCGKCGRQCPDDQDCELGLCKCKSGQEESQLCLGKCVDFLTDNFNCGGCGKKCPSQKVCNNGNCECVDRDNKKIHACGDDTNGYVCVDFFNDRKHCGSCTNKCPSAMDCVDGSCQCTGELPDACGQLCVDLSKDPFNCGSCGNLCATGQPCVNGVCQAEATCGLDQCVCSSATPCVAGLSVLADGDFGSCTLEGTHKDDGYAYTCPSSQNWTCTSTTSNQKVVCIKSNSKPWGSPDAIGHSDYLLGIQHKGTSIAQTVKVVKGISYTLSLYAASRTKGKNSGESYDLATLKITVQGVEVYKKELSAQPLGKISIAFVASGSTAPITLSNDSPDGDRTVFLGNVAITPNQVPVADWDFSGCSASVPSVPSVPGYFYACPSSSWSCSTQGTQYAVACIESGNSDWGYPKAGGSSQYVVGLQKNGAKISQDVDVMPDTSYTVTVYANSRNNGLATLAILVDGVIRSLNPLPPLPGTAPGTLLSEVSFTFTPRASKVNIAFMNQSPDGDLTVFLSNVTITTTVPCDSRLTRCSGLWVDLASDSLNCGVCGKTCSGSCTNSVCSPAPAVVVP